MTYSSGGLIQATDYNGFVSTSANNLGNIWGTGSGDKGWGQSTTGIAVVSAGGVVTATQWATLVANLSAAGSQTSSTLTSRTQPVAGNTIAVLANVATDINTVTTNRGNAAASGTTIGTFSGTTSKTTATGSGGTTWTITFTHTITFASTDAARYFFNAGGLVKVMYGKSSTGTDADADWNTFAGKCGNIFLGGYINSASQTIGGVAYTGTTRIGGTGGTQTTLATTTGYYQLTGTPATIFKLTDDAATYTGDYIQTNASQTSGVITLTTTWFSATVSGAGQSRNISGGTAVASPATAIGAATAPTTLVNLVPPSTTYLTASWGTPTIAASVA